MTRKERLARWIEKQIARFTWPWVVSRTGLAGLVYMLFEPSSATPALVVAFAAMVGIKPIADLDQFIGRSKDDERKDRDA